MLFTYDLSMTSTQALAGLADNRTIHLVDPENLFCGTAFDAAATSRLAGIYPHYDAAHDQVVIGASCMVTAVEAGLGWTGSRLVWRRGRDGADLSLAAVMLNEDLEHRFARVIIGSGDGIFTPIAAYLASRGLHVGVVARHGHLSRTLRMAAHRVDYLPEEHFQSGIAPSGLIVPSAYRSAA